MSDPATSETEGRPAHTPGPWTVAADKTHPWQVQCPQLGFPEDYKGIVCHVGYKPNAHLIAAAPELLSALVAILPDAADAFVYGRAVDGDIPETEIKKRSLERAARHAAARAAISKATGAA